MEYTEIIDGFLNGNKKWAVEQIEKSSWYDFATELEEDPMLTSQDKVEIFASLIRISNR